MAEPYTIFVPKQNWGRGGREMLSRLTSWEWRVPRDRSELLLDFSNTQFIEPWAITMFVSHALYLKAEFGIQPEAILEHANPANQYLMQMGLRDVLETETSTPDWDDSDQSTGLHIIRQHSDVIRFRDSLKALDLYRNDETSDALQYCVAEIGRNVVQHAASSSGGVAMAQVFPDREAVQITVCDCGQGVLSALKETHPELRNDREALKAAVLPHVSGAFKSGTYSASDNAGLGLFFTKEIAWRAGGSFFLVSGKEILSEHSSEGTRPTRKYTSVLGRVGTSVTVDIPINRLVDFASLLELCRELARAARNSPGEAGLDFLQELPDIEGMPVVHVGEFSEDVERAATVRDNLLMPAVRNGDMVVLDFSGARFATQSFVHALLNDALKEPGSLTRLSFVNCTKSTEEAIRAVAAYAATYRMCV